MRCTLFVLMVICCGYKPVKADVQDAALKFSTELLQKMLDQESGNVIVSPVSVHIMLAMIQQGAGGNTKEQLDRVIHADESATRQIYHDLTRDYQHPLDYVELEFASKMFIKKGFDILSQFREVLVSDFLADIETLDFNNQERAVHYINSWIANSTHNKITELFQPDQIKKETYLVSTSAVYFQSHFDTYFEKEATQNRTFSPSPSEEIQVPTMYQENLYKAGESSELGAKWVHITFKLGAEDIFKNTANLLGITEKNTKVSDFLQKATLAVDENAVTASGATGATSQPISGIVIPDVEEMEFTADQPFLVFIIDHIHGIPLFAGRVTNPLNV